MSAPILRPALVGLALLMAAPLMAQANDSYPDELKLEHPAQREIANKPGLELEAMQAACPVSMLNASPGNAAKNIHERILRTMDGVIIETDADLTGVPFGTGTTTIPATYRCEYRDGQLVLGIWSKGLIGKWTLFQSPRLTQSELGTPWPDYLKSN
ncbi:hypothetical protein [Ferrovum myxofaciens]|jgi:hypothetical protein|uniref:Uncharacterized protein n=2 Tax=root TaxID=1 RepID=A0A8F3DWU9_9PROT|nr:hypothetical protein [Ferrovum myxofaciens]KXW58238.1 hypothetical protein FEMY_12390 [Ferrovum myxofaciens]MBU6995184.1 hypothetical protein [Ferrovum myxofaciens]QKE39002.1 MAG: hypothetical protein HO273_09920 [Ferrovum myxofaciens]QKE41556.1 MAG: hypothetical protein HO274_09690 [Ferrovum myxofaciens]QWY74231.1 MAG: hypothetical protein JVY19_10465 [Ferrovum myxofaciens]